MSRGAGRYASLEGAPTRSPGIFWISCTCEMMRRAQSMLVRSQKPLWAPGLTRPLAPVV